MTRETLEWVEVIVKVEVSHQEKLKSQVTEQVLMLEKELVLLLVKG